MGLPQRSRRLGNGDDWEVAAVLHLRPRGMIVACPPASPRRSSRAPSRPCCTGAAWTPRARRTGAARASSLRRAGVACAPRYRRPGMARASRPGRAPVAPVSRGRRIAVASPSPPPRKPRQRLNSLNIRRRPPTHPFVSSEVEKRAPSATLRISTSLDTNGGADVGSNAKSAEFNPPHTPAPETPAPPDNAQPHPPAPPPTARGAPRTGARHGRRP